MTGRMWRPAHRLLCGMLVAALAMASPAAALAEGVLVAAGEDAPLGEELVAVPEVPQDDVADVTGDPEAPGDDVVEPVGEPQDVVDEGQPGDEPAADDQPEASETPDVPADPAADGQADAQEAAPIAAAGAALGEAPADAVTIGEGTYVLQATLAKTLLVEAQGKAPVAGAAVQTAAYAGGKNQRWVVRRYQDTSWYRLHLTANNGLALGVESAASGSAVRVLTVGASDQAETLWAFVPNADGSYRLVSAAGPAFALAVKGSSTKAGAVLVLGASKDKTNERIALVSAAPAVEAGTKGLEGAYQLTERKSGLVATIAGGKTANGTNLQLAAGKGAKSQQVYLEPVDGGGYYVLWVVGTRKVLSVAGSSVLSGANVHQYAYKGLDAQKWAVRKNADGTLSFQNKGTGLLLAAEGVTSGANIAGMREGSSFKAKRIALLKAGVVEIKPQTTSAVSLSIAGASTKSGARVLLWKDTNALNQRFQLVGAGKTDLWRVRTGSSGGYLAVKGGMLSQQGKGATKAGATNTWRVTFRGGWYGLMLDDGSERAMAFEGGKTAKGTKLVVAAADGTDAQHLSFQEADLLKPGVYFLQNAKGKFLDVDGNSSFSGANVQTYKKMTSRLLGEYFTIEKAGAYVRIKNTYSELCVTARGKKNGANVAMRGASTADAQKWLPQISDGGHVVFSGVGAYKNLALHVSRGSAKNGANVVVGKLSGGVAQRWKPVATTYNPYTGYMLKALRTANASGSATNYLMVVDRANTHVMVMKRNGATWKLHRNYLCSCGKQSTPTITGSYTVGSRGYQFTDGDHTCYYWTEIRGDYLFHSVLYRAGTMTKLDGRLGFHISMGCVRLDIKAAKWIYDTIPSGTKIVIY